MTRRTAVLLFLLAVTCALAAFSGIALWAADAGLVR
jgi:hypothetical protein